MSMGPWVVRGQRGRHPLTAVPPCSLAPLQAKAAEERVARLERMKTKHRDTVSTKQLVKTLAAPVVKETEVRCGVRCRVLDRSLAYTT